MENRTGVNRLEVDVGEVIYEIELGQVQIEITGRCNMHCQHCRAAYQLRSDMPIEQIVKIVRFVQQFSTDGGKIVLSGGEPLIHRDFPGVLESIRHCGGEFITLTTNGSLLTKEHLRLIENLSFKCFTLSVSLDSLDPAKHDRFRGCKGAFAKAVDALRLIAESSVPSVVACMRSTIQASQIDEMEELVEYARRIGCKGIGFSSVQPAGRAVRRPDLWMSRKQKLAFLECVYQLKEKFPDINIDTNDPLKCLVCDKSDVGRDSELVFDGCGAAVTMFNVDADGTMTPCALLNLPMMNVFPLTVEEITENYRSSPIVKNMLAMNLKGKCSECDLKYRCGGCRARAYAQRGDYLEEDPHCWMP